MCQALVEVLGSLVNELVSLPPVLTLSRLQMTRMVMSSGDAIKKDEGMRK